MKKHSALVIKHDKKFLFIQRSLQKKTLPGKWGVPTGTVEEGETVFQTAQREGQEELGISIHPQKIIVEKEVEEFNAHLSFVLCTTEQTNLTPDPNEIIQTAWMSFEEFYERFTDEDIGHGLRWIRNNPELWKGL